MRKKKKQNHWLELLTKESTEVNGEEGRKTKAKMPTATAASYSYSSFFIFF